MGAVGNRRGSDEDPVRPFIRESCEDYLEAILVIRAERGFCRNVDAASRKHKTFNVLFHMQFLNHGAADNCDNKPKDHIDDRHFCTENAH